MSLNKVDDPKVATLPSLDRPVSLFAVALYQREQVFLTGGSGGGDRATSVLNIKNKSWQDGPRLNHGRKLHCSLCLGSDVFVFGGMNVGSIESLRVGSDQGWSIIAESSEMIQRAHSVAFAINNEDIVIFGGDRKGGYALNVVSKSVRPILGAQSDVAF